MRDSHYTPSVLANHLISFINKEDVFSVADFCVGKGDLLKAANNKWPNIEVYGCDISEKIVKQMKKDHSDWKLSKCDFLNPNSRNKSVILRNKFDLILLNPPFTCKGSTIKSLYFENTLYHMSTAMAFFVGAIQYLEDNGVMYAILPQSVAYSQKDEKIRSYLIEKYNFRILEEKNNQEFGKCTPNIVLASINEKNVSPIINMPKKITTGIKQIKIQRGNISMHEISEVKKKYLYLIHSTNLKNGKIVDLKYKVNNVRSKIEGPALLIHRVGHPNINKICIIPFKKAYALSDCVIGLKCETIEECRMLERLIVENWSDFSNLYKGTGAKYITIERLKDFLTIY